jgi:PAS domain S-box-containing protein
MSDAILVNLHCHSIFSDGDQTPEALAGNLAGAGVRCAALTDHDSIEGLQRFADALKKRGIAFLPGVELTTQHAGRELHLLGYGFDPQHAELAATLLSLRQSRNVEVHSIAGSLRRAGASRPEDPNGATASAAPNGSLDTSDAIALIHRAGGRAFLAHPLVHEPDLNKLDALLIELAAQRLDGIEAVYAAFSESQQTALRALARRHGLLVCAGTDFHSAGKQGLSDYAIAMPREDWIAFRAAMFAGMAPLPFGEGLGVGSSATPIPRSLQRLEPASGVAATSHQQPRTAKPHRFRRRSFALRIVLPTLVAMGLFLAAFWGFVLPSFESTLLERKREMIRELTHSAWSILASLEREVQAGRLTREQAQARASDLIRTLRYGPEGKDYFWIQDGQPRMIMHPYRADLNGQLLTGFTDPRGVKIFVEFANQVQRASPDTRSSVQGTSPEDRGGEGYLDYVWQWNDDPTRLEPKESYVKGFAPWGWIIGTGLYIDDVRQEIARIEQRLIVTALAVFVAIATLLLFVLQQSLRIERERQEVVDSLRESTERYHTLVEAATEGMLLVLEDRCRYANPTLLNLLGYAAQQLEFLELADVLPKRGDNLALWDGMRGADAAAALPAQLARSDGSLVDCIVMLNPISYAGQAGFLLLARAVTPAAENAHDEVLAASQRQIAERDATIESLQAPLLALHKPIAALAGAPVLCKLDATVEQAAQQMTARNATAVLVESESGAAIGMVTDRDLRARVLGNAAARNTPIHAVMSAPLLRISENAPAFEALLRMSDCGVRHLAVEDAGGRISGIVDQAALMHVSRYGPAALLRALAHAKTPNEVAEQCRRALPLARSLLQSSARPRHVIGFLTSICDAATQRLIVLAMCEMEPPPAPFAFIALGSQGRQELNLLSDQDNGIVYSLSDGDDAAQARDYFLKLGARVSAGLRDAGYPFCRGNVMASNPRWCRSLPEWLASFEAWVRQAEPQEIADLSITLDFRAVHGDAELTREMRRRIHALLQGEPAFLQPFAQNALSFKPPLRLGNLYLGGDGEHAGEIDLKDATMPIVSFARLYALRHAIDEAGTLARLNALVDAGHMQANSRDEIALAFDFLMQLRLRNQLALLDAGQPASNRIHPSRLGHIEQEMLKQAFAQISALQKKVGYDFAGAAV